MRVRVDHDLCEANAVCEGLVPDVFHVNDEDVLEIRQPEPPDDLEADVRMAVDRCPKLALFLDE